MFADGDTSPVSLGGKTSTTTCYLLPDRRRRDPGDVAERNYTGG